MGELYDVNSFYFFPQRKTFLINENGVLAGKLAKDIGLSLQTICKLKGLAKWVEPGSLPNDGKVIDDVRDFGD